MPDLKSADPAWILSQPLSVLPGVGPKVQTRLQKLGLSSLEDAIYHLPYRYEDRRQLKPIRQLSDGSTEVFKGTVLASGESRTKRTSRRIYEVIVGDDSGTISLKWFHYRKNWLEKRLPIGQTAIFIGDVKRFGATREVHHPDAELIQGNDDMALLSRKDPVSFGRIVPVYPLTEGISQKQIRSIWFPLIRDYAHYLSTTTPDFIRKQYQLLDRQDAIRQIHWPDKQSNLYQLEQGRHPGRKSLVFDEFFYLEMGLALKRAGVQLQQGSRMPCEHRYTLPLSKMLPFKLTAAQRRVLGEIKDDMASPHPMNRLLQGDVGSGKTVVALMAALIAIENDFQVAVVAPTEILAEQHYRTFAPWLERLGLTCCLLQGSTSQAEKKNTYARITAGDINLVAGTHAVLQEGVEFQRLGLGIVDEQHRFGVRQRGILKTKGNNPDILVMTATPIPRTLSMTLYGDLSVSVIDELPPGRKTITTRIIHQRNRAQAHELIHAELKKGRQAYIVYPLVEESEKSDLQAATIAAQQLIETFPEHQIGLLHGQMKSAEKEAVMNDFRSGKIAVLVATTVIEVGVDVPNATLMVIEHADRFGLAQLHQLRGRVGRGAEQSYCILIPSEHYSEDAQKRLDVMIKTDDGFRIAEADLEIRGPGDFLGTRQAGLPDFRVASLTRDVSILEAARQAAFNYIEQTDHLTTPEARPVREELIKRWGSRLELANIG
ncbi:ATP-dependent DNA helicase RecG [Pelovirga terrestris]|uniref:ATP-dependent DNA helicase RecG n=1 Tax=Pelovirga terrestris TaxID=2771352 RepID=A0A8J6QLF7_9BACT|nr:ATP-dependent DNA helicase RecG [Pelovirga terrestris]MBD1399277.1 ATP-dependent DNA helicase RecG [Pelovirga terrestris]